MFVFTIVTIVFLPLSFIASLISMPVREYPRYATGQTEPGFPIRTAYLWVFGIGTAILVPLMVLAVGVNHITKFTEGKLRQAPSPHAGGYSSDEDSASSNNSASDTTVSDDDDDNSDDDTTSDGHWSKLSTRTINSRRRRRRRRHRRRLTSSSSSSATSTTTAGGHGIDPDYALLLGRWAFHARVPLLRRLWRYTASVALNDDFSMESFRVYDYPFRRLVEQPLGRLALRFGCGRAWAWVVGGANGADGAYLAERSPRQDWWRALWPWRGHSGASSNGAGDGGAGEGKEKISRAEEVQSTRYSVRAVRAAAAPMDVDGEIVHPARSGGGDQFVYAESLGAEEESDISPAIHAPSHHGGGGGVPPSDANDPPAGGGSLPMSRSLPEGGRRRRFLGEMGG